MIGMLGVEASNGVDDAIQFVLLMDVPDVAVVVDEVDAPEHRAVDAGALDEREPRIERVKLLLGLYSVSGHGRSNVG